MQITKANEAYDVTPITDFSDEDKFSMFKDTIKKMQFDKLTPIQSVGIPIVMSGQDLVGIAKTGSGKTLAFMLPCIHHTRNYKREYKSINGEFYPNASAPLAVVLTPTRELANQIFDASLPFSTAGKTFARCVYGGRSIEQQSHQLSNGVDILIGTPGRIIDLVQRGSLDLGNVGFFVLDEADRMLDMGFMPQIQAIFDAMNAKRQTVMFSATWPKEVEELSDLVFQNTPVQIKIGDASLTVNDKIKQSITKTNEMGKIQELMNILEAEENSKV